MIFPESKLFVVDNSGAKIVKCIKVYNSSRRRGSKPLGIVIGSIRKVKQSKRFSKGELCKGVLVRLKKYIQRDTGFTLKFSNNSMIIIDLKNIPIGSRLYGPLFKEFRFADYQKVLSLARAMV